MKIIVLGGAGEMGTRAAEELASADGVERITIADKNEAAARKAASSIESKCESKGAAVEMRAVDAFDHAGLVEALRGHDVAASAVGPFFLFEERLVQAALDAGVDYCSICDEWEPAISVLDRFDAPAKEKGITVLTGLGASPGLTNMAARQVANEMDTVQRIQVAVYLPLDCGAQGAALRHALYIMSGDTAVWRGGQPVKVGACTEKRAVEFPRFGTIDVWNMGHSEPATLPRYLPGVSDVDFFIGYGPGTSLIAFGGRIGAFNGKRRAAFFARATEAVEHLFAKGEPGWGATRIDAWGETDGEQVHVLRCGVGEMRETTGLSLAAGAYLLGKGELTVNGGGAFAPEGCLDPDAFFDYLRARGVTAYADMAMEEPV